MNKIKKYILLTFFISSFLAKQFILAEEKLFQGEINFDFGVFSKNPGNTAFPSRWFEIDFRPKYEKEFSQRINTFFQGKLRHNFNSEIRNRYILNEGYFDFYTGKFDVRLGKQVISWGRADSLKPTDHFKIYDYSDLAKQDEEGIPAVKIDYFLNGYDLEGIFVPVFVKHHFDYSRENRWNPLSYQAFPGNYRVIFEEDNSLDPSRNISSSQFGFRLNRQGKKIDYAFSYSAAYDKMPVSIKTNLKSVNNNTNEAIYNIQPFYSGLKTVGFDWETFLYEFGFRGEMAYSFTKDKKGQRSDIDDPYFQLVTGVDKTFYRVIYDINLFVILQYALDKEFPIHGEENQVEHGFRHFFRQMVLLNSEFKRDELKKFIIKGMYDLEKKDYILQPELKIVSSFGRESRFSKEIYLKADVLAGRTGTFFGAFGKNDRVEAGVNLYF
ncbi:MAG: DUF1302 family protein [bacterium]